MAAVTAPPLVSLKTILVATDFSPGSHVALLYAAALARRQKGKIFLAHVVPQQPLSSIPMDSAPIYTLPAAQDPRFRMKQAISVPELAGIEYEMLLEEGQLWSVLEKMMEDHHIELVVVGTHGRGGLSKLVLGSVAEQVFRRAPCPVVTVGPHVSPQCLHEGRLCRVLFATDLSAASMHALPYVAMLAGQHQAALTFLHVLASAVPVRSGADFAAPNFVEREIEDAREHLREIVPANMSADVVVEFGIPAEIIVRVAQDHDASLIVMGLHSQSLFAATHLPWTTAHRVVCEAHCPVLTLR